MMEKGDTGVDGAKTADSDVEVHRESNGAGEKNDSADGGGRGKQRNDNASGDDSIKDASHCSDGSDIETSSLDSYESHSSISEESIGNSSGDNSNGSSSSYESSSDESDGSSASQDSCHSRSGRSNEKYAASNHRGRRSPSPDQSTLLASASTSNYSPNRTIHRGVLPIVTHGLSPAPRLGIDQNCDPNRSTLIHRRGKSAKDSNSDSHEMQQHRNLPQCRSDDGERDRGQYKSSRRHRSNKSSRHHRRKRTLQTPTNYIAKYICCQAEKRSTQLLVLGFAIWILAQCYYFYYVSWKDFILDNTEDLRRGFFESDSNFRGGRSFNERRGKVVHHGVFNHRDMYVQRSPKEMEELRVQRMKEAQAALGNGAGEFDDTAWKRDAGGKPGKPNNRRVRDGGKNGRKKDRDEEGNTRTERLSDGCSKLEWHLYHFPNCNEIHEVDMRGVVRHRRHRRDRRSDDDSSSTPWGFVGNGLWRDVFSCDPRGETAASNTPVPPAVLKIMKSEHPYDQRNFQRHRRDALVMERLSSSHHLVPIYGYCANTVLTQAISHTLDDVIYARENEKVKKWSPHGGYKTKPPLESWMGKDEQGELLATRETELGRIKLALGVFRGLMDLHEGDGTSKTEWLPIVHADLQSKQYLVDAETGQVYLNDFNRCRFMAKKDHHTNFTGKNVKASGKGNSTNLESCPIYIPTAPGASRSPEEYDMAPLSEKLDIYSAGNILYGIITGKKPWNGDRGKHIKAAIQKGERPEVDGEIRNDEGSVDAELTKLLDRVYEADPETRASAKEIVDALERLLDRKLKKDVALGSLEDRPALVERKTRTGKPRKEREAKKSQ